MGFYILLTNYQIITIFLLAISLLTINSSATNIIWTEVTFAIDYMPPALSFFKWLVKVKDFNIVCYCFAELNVFFCEE